MYKEISQLIIYRDLNKNSILYNLGEIFRKFDEVSLTKDELINEIYIQVNKLLKLATDYGFNENLWQNYLTYLLVTQENPFAITCEKIGANDGSVDIFALNDFKIFKQLFHYDFTEIEEYLGINCFTVLCNYQAVGKKERMYNKNVSEKVQHLSRQINKAQDENEIFKLVTEFYKDNGVGLIGLNNAFRIEHEDKLELIPINNLESVSFDDLIGYEIQKKMLIDNTEAFVEGRAANNVLLFGDSGTGKSTCIKAIINKYAPQGLRMIEIYKHQFKDLSSVISKIKNRNYKFIIYMDDLSFEEFEIEYKYLKAVIEGGLEIKPDNVLIYATSNRRHLIRETWNDRSDMDQELHRSDTMEEKLSLVNRFGVTISFSKPSRKEFNNIVKELAAKHPEITLTEEEILAEANKWEMLHGGVSGRTARQFIDYLLGRK